MSEIKNALVFLLLQRKGGETTAKVIEQLLIRPIILIKWQMP